MTSLRPFINNQPPKNSSSTLRLDPSRFLLVKRELERARGVGAKGMMGREGGSFPSSFPSHHSLRPHSPRSFQFPLHQQETTGIVSVQLYDLQVKPHTAELAQSGWGGGGGGGTVA